ncbi:serine hydrolase domain-containing protein [Flagellimonas algicola]|uniref:Serine hydrolase n=1 Tax=Flagellimonas algicola TaxID=2583815 RepID=A0ABY2WIU3_9FLAO|nr:serine hydrolase domain-containing protein [Allomuricauda algicola]TMU54481.1 serine hydrolase [Allomuricauda algicola]
MKLLQTLLLLLPISIWSQSIAVDSLDAYISKLVNEYDIPGLAIGVIHKDSVIFKKGYGYTSLEQGLAIDTKTVFPILSCTKAFTAAGVGILVDEGKLNWDDKVIKHLPEFKLSDPWITKEIRISDLLAHRSGLRAFDGDLLWYGTNHTTQEVIEKIQYYPIKSSFRLDFNYNNVMYLVAGRIIEKVSGLSLDEFLKTKIFDVLGMQSSSAKYSELVKSSKYVRPHIADKPIVPVSLDNAVAAGGINSSIEDMLLWLQMCLNEGTLSKKVVISQNNFETMTSPKIPLDNQGAGSYGFGWYIDYDDSQKVLYHGGGMPGYKSMVTFYPEHGIGIVVLTNKITMINEGLVTMISSYLIQPELTDWSENRKYFTYFNYSWDNPQSIQIAPNIPTDFQRYEGLYEDKVYGQAQVKMVNSDAILELLPSKDNLSGKLYYLDKLRFKIKFKDPFLPLGEVVFEIDENLNIIGFRLDVPNDDFNFDNLNFWK